MTEPLTHRSLISPQYRRRHPRRRNELSDGLEHLANESFRCPISHGDRSAGAAHTQQLPGYQLRPWSEHSSEQAGYDIEAGIFEGKVFRVAFHKTCMKIFCFGSRLRSLDQISSDVH